MKPIARVALLLSAAMLSPSCTLSRHASSAGVDRLLVFLSPAALNLDGEPGPDGFSATLFAVRGEHHKSVALTSGAIKFSMYAGTPPSSELEATAPEQVWTFSLEELEARETRSPVGVAYKFAEVLWAPERAPVGDVTIVVEYLPPSGDAVRAEPIALAVR